MSGFWLSRNVRFSMFHLSVEVVVLLLLLCFFYIRFSTLVWIFCSASARSKLLSALGAFSPAASPRFLSVPSIAGTDCERRLSRVNLKSGKSGHFYLARTGHYYLATTLIFRIIYIMLTYKLMPHYQFARV